MKIIPIKQPHSVAELRDRLIQFAHGDAVLEKMIERMNDKQIKAAEEALQGSLCQLVDRKAAADAAFKNFISFAAKQDRLVIASVIDWVVDFCEKYPKDGQDNADDINYTQQSVIVTEMHKVVEEVLKKIVKE
jgi:hypothetical protein